MALVTDPPTLSLVDKLHAYRAIGAYVDPASFCALRAASKTLRDSTVVAGFRFWFERRLSQAPARGHKARMNAMATRGRYAWLLGADAVEFLLRALREDKAQTIRAAAALWLCRVARRSADPLKRRVFAVAADRYDVDVEKRHMTSRIAIEENVKDLLDDDVLDRLFPGRKLVLTLHLQSLAKERAEEKKKGEAEWRAKRAQEATLIRRRSSMARALAPLAALIDNRYLGRGADLIGGSVHSTDKSVLGGGGSYSRACRVKYMVPRGDGDITLMLRNPTPCAVTFSASFADDLVIAPGEATHFADLDFFGGMGLSVDGSHFEAEGPVFRLKARYGVPDVRMGKLTAVMPASELWTFELKDTVLTYRVDGITDYELFDAGFGATYREVETRLQYRFPPGKHVPGYGAHGPPPAPPLKAGSRLTTDEATAFLQWKAA